MIKDKFSTWMNAFLLIGFIAFGKITAYAQVVNHGVDVTLVGDVKVHVHNAYTDSLGGAINNDGQLFFYQSLTNRMESQLINPDGAGRILFNGKSDQYLTGKGLTFGNAEIDKPGGILILNDSISISGQLIFMNGNLFLNGNDLLLGSSGRLSGEQENSYVYGTEGAIRATDRFINGPDINDNMAGLGIFFGTPGDFGRSTIIRRNRVIPDVSGGSIMRQYEFTPENNNFAFPTSVKINYLSHEIADIEKSSLSIWRDDDKHGQWTLENSIVEEGSDIVTAGIVENLGRSVLTLASRDCPDAPNIQLGEAEQIVCAGSTLLLNTRLDDPKYSYTWYHDNVIMEENTASISVSDSGFYRVEVVQANGCNASSEVVVIQKKLPVVSFESSEACFGSTTEFTNLSSIDEGTLTYFWDFGESGTDADTSGISDPAHIYPASGSYGVTLTAKSEAGCENTLQQEINVLALPEVVFATDGRCHGDKTFFTAEASIPEGQNGAFYVWDFDGVDTSEGKEVSYTFEESGAHEVKLKITTDKTCSASMVATVDINPVVEPSFTAVPQCEPNKVLITNTTAPTDEIESQVFHFHDGATSSSDNFIKTYESSGVYEITLVASMKSGCEASVSHEVTVDMREPLLVDEVTTCGNSYAFSFDPSVLPAGSTWSWNDGTLETEYVATNSGVHWLEVKYPDGCIYRDSVSVTLNSLLTLELEDNVTSCGPVTLEAGEFPDASYLWSDGSTGSSLTVTETGTYTVQVTDQNNCVSEASSEVIILPVPEFDLGEDTILCDGGEVVLSPGIENMTYHWSDGSTGRLITVTSEGTYGLTITNDKQCSAYDEIKVSFHEPYKVSLGNDNVICEGSSLVLTTELPASEYLWGENDEVLSTGRSLEVAEEGEYWVIAKDEFGCTGSDTVYVSRKERPTARFLASSEVEIGDTLQFVQLSYPDTLSFTWEFGDGNSSADEDPVHIYFEEGEYNVKLKVDNGACTDEIDKRVKVVPVGTPTFDFEGFSNSLIDEINIYPNPFETIVNLEIKLNRQSEAYVRIAGINGIVKKKISFKAMEWSGAIDLSGELNGVYLLSVFVGDESKVFRLIKQ